MGKALAIQTSKASKLGLAVVGATRAFSGKPNTGKAGIHTSNVNKARAVDDSLFARNNGKLKIVTLRSHC